MKNPIGKWKIQITLVLSKVFSIENTMVISKPCIDISQKETRYVILLLVYSIFSMKSIIGTRNKMFVPVSVLRIAFRFTHVTNQCILLFC